MTVCHSANSNTMTAHGGALVIILSQLFMRMQKEIERFTDAKAIVVEGNHLTRKVLYGAEEFYKIVSYNSVCNDIKILKSLHTDFLIMDEVHYQNFYEFPKFRIKLLILILLHFNIVRIIY